MPGVSIKNEKMSVPELRKRAKEKLISALRNS
jgi:hypothetical protein